MRPGCAASVTGERKLLLAGALGLTAALAVFVAISHAFAYEIPWTDRPTAALVAIMMAAGLAYLGLVAAQSRAGLQRAWFGSLIALGMALRVAMLFSTPVYEDDFYRYFWDGALVAKGLNPYAQAPNDVLPVDFPLAEAGVATDDVPAGLKDLADEPDVARVPYPSLKTIYPPATQAFFWLSHTIAPWNLTAWRLLLLAVDAATLLLLMKLLARLGRARHWSLVYWLNPLALTEIHNGGHMDVLLLPFLLAAVLFALRRRFALGGVALAGAVGVKFWPVVLAPLLFRPLFAQPRKLAAAALPFGVLVCLLVSPQLLTKPDETSGLAAYTLDWQTNAFLFPLIERAIGILAQGDGIGLFEPNILARLAIGGLVAASALWLARRPFSGGDGPIDACLAVTALLFFVSPTGYPWYAIWFLPWLAIYPHPALLLLTVTLPLYDLRYPLQLGGQQELFEALIVPLQFLPSLIILAYETTRKARRRAAIAG